MVSAAAQQAYAIAQARGVTDDVAAIIAVMEELAAPMPATAAHQTHATSQTGDEDDTLDFIKAIEQLAGISEQ